VANESSTVRVRMSDGSKWIIPRESLLRAKARGAVEDIDVGAPTKSEEGWGGTYKKLERGAVLGAASGVGIDPQTRTEASSGKQVVLSAVRKWMESMGATADEIAHADVDKLAERLRGMAKGVGGAVHEAHEGFSARDPEEFAHGLASLGTQLAMLKGGKEAAGSSLAESEAVAAAKAAGRAPETITREFTGTTRQEIAKSRRVVEEANAEKTKEFADKAAQARAKARGEYEAGETAKAAEREKLVSETRAKARATAEAAEATRRAKNEAAELEAKMKHEAKLQAYEDAVSGKVTREAHARLKNARLEAATKKLTGYRDSLVKQLTDNIRKARKAEGDSLDARYNTFKQQVLGVTKETPNGTLQSQLSPIGEAVIDAKKNILKGSRTSIPIFNDIMGRLKDLIEMPDGTVRPMEGQMLHTDQLRGYEKELGSALYEKNLPGDVRQAVDAVRKKIHSEVIDTIKDRAGQKAAEVYEKLSEDWSAYKRVWYDQSAVNPLPRIREMIEDPTVVHEGIPVESRVAKMLRDERGESVVSILANKKAFGADHTIPARLMQIDKKLGGLKDFYEKVPVTTYPRVPKYEAPKLEEPGTVSEYKVPKLPEETTEARFEAPKPPDLEHFDMKKFIEGKLGTRASQVQRYSMIIPAFQLLHDIVRGQAPSIDLAAGPALGIAINKLLTSKRMVDWLSKEAPTP
jgi:hypothetical protein